jgi:hypothetical protein
LRETLLKKEENGLEVIYIKGSNYEQVKISTNSGAVPDPRVGGSSIIFDSRLDQNETREPPKMLSALGERPNQYRPAYE